MLLTGCCFGENVQKEQTNFLFILICLPFQTWLERLAGVGHVGPRLSGAPECCRGNSQRSGGSGVPAVSGQAADTTAAPWSCQQHPQAARWICCKYTVCVCVRNISSKIIMQASDLFLQTVRLPLLAYSQNRLQTLPDLNVVFVRTSSRNMYLSGVTAGLRLRHSFNFEQLFVLRKSRWISSIPKSWISQTTGPRTDTRPFCPVSTATTQIQNCPHLSFPVEPGSTFMWAGVKFKGQWVQGRLILHPPLPRTRMQP